MMGKTAACFAPLLRTYGGRVGLDSGGIIRRPLHIVLRSGWGGGDLGPLWSGQAPPRIPRSPLPISGGAPAQVCVSQPQTLLSP